MKLTLTFHAADQTDAQLYDAVTEENARHQFVMTEDEYEERIDTEMDKLLRERLARWVKDGCCISVEFDLAKGTATVKDSVQ